MIEGMKDFREVFLQIAEVREISEVGVNQMVTKLKSCRHRISGVDFTRLSISSLFRSILPVITELVLKESKDRV